MTIRIALALVAMIGLQAAAGVVYNQPPDGSGTIIKSAWYAPDGLDGDAYAWDAFVLGTDQALTEIHWRGGYTNYLSGAGRAPVYDFTVSIYPSIAGGFQPDIVHPPLVQYDVGGNAGETVVGTFGGVLLYDYAYVLPVAFHATANVKYWVQIEAWQGVTPQYGWPPDWGFNTASSGDGSFFYEIIGGTGGGGNLYYSHQGNLAFALLTPGPTMYTISASAAPVDAGTITGAGSYAQGSTATLVATPHGGYRFDAWTENGTTVSTSASYSFTVSSNRTLVANFSIHHGDVNCDGVVSFADINPFVQLLSDAAGWQAAYPSCPMSTGDFNGDGVVNFADINPFVACLANGGCP